MEKILEKIQNDGVVFEKENKFYTIQSIFKYLGIISIIIGFILVWSYGNDIVRDACTHGNCIHGWDSKNTGTEQFIAILIRFIYFIFLLIPFLWLINKKIDKYKRVNGFSIICPICGSGTKLKLAKRGINYGRKFWGCSKYPNCRGVVSIKDTV